MRSLSHSTASSRPQTERVHLIASEGERSKLGRPTDNTSSFFSLPKSYQPECSRAENPTSPQRGTCPTSTAAASRTAAEMPLSRLAACAPGISRARGSDFYSNTFKSQSRISYPLFVCLFVIVLFSSVCVSSTSAQTTSLSLRENVDCTYASSTCVTCTDVCVPRQYYPLFPSRCHPSYSVSQSTKL